jgi:hypothetical protein
LHENIWNTKLAKKRKGSELRFLGVLGVQIRNYLTAENAVEAELFFSAHSASSAV